jgi:hypothetical protein
MSCRTWATGDIYLAAYLVAKGYEVIETYGEKRKSFVFADTAKTEVNAYRAGEPVSGLTYAEAIRYTKRLAHGGSPRGVPTNHVNRSNHPRQG